MSWVRKRVRQKDTVYLAGYTDPAGAQRSAGTFRTRSEAKRAAYASERKVEEGTWLDRNAGKVSARELPSGEADVAGCTIPMGEDAAVTAGSLTYADAAS